MNNLRIVECDYCSSWTGTCMWQEDHVSFFSGESCQISS